MRTKRYLNVYQRLIKLISVAVKAKSNHLYFLYSDAQEINTNCGNKIDYLISNSKAFPNNHLRISVNDAEKIIEIVRRDAEHRKQIVLW